MPPWSSRSSPSPASSSKRCRWALVPSLLVGAGLAFSGCGSSESAAMLDTSKIERAIARSSLAQRGAHPKVSCPPEVAQEKGLVFSCIAVIEGTRTRFIVTQQDDAGRVRYEAP
ncbi:MAG TPA: DUF4333 domain-containing protein [Gemmatimonadales bacterium]|nr:DUF4333 domain-containing protein [Gemmatimonadales bacterium]